MTELFLKGGNIIDVLKGEIYRGDIYIRDGLIMEIIKSGDLLGEKYKQVPTIELYGKYISPGFIESHIHIESSMVTPSTFCSRSACHGTTTIFADPHEITNVYGASALEFFLDESSHTAVDLFIGIPSCVPATHLEDNGGEIGLDDVRRFLSHPKVYGLGEMMNYPGIISGSGNVRKMVDLVYDYGKLVDGHCPSLAGSDLLSYMSNGRLDNVCRISSDHECTTASEAMEKVERGMMIALRMGSASNDLERILPNLLRAGVRDFSNYMLCSDDLDCIDLLKDGHIDRVIIKAINIFENVGSYCRIDALIEAIRMATINPARHYDAFFKLGGLPLCGAIISGYKANLAIFDSLLDPQITMTIINGKTVFDGNCLDRVEDPISLDRFCHSVKMDRVAVRDFRIKASSEDSVKTKLIGVINNSLFTNEVLVDMHPIDGEIFADVSRDIAKIAVFDRHRLHGEFSIALVHGLGLTNGGALASTIAHDSHNLVVVGTDDVEMANLANHLIELGGGLGVSTPQGIVSLALPVAGLMSCDNIEVLAKNKEAVIAVAKELTGNTLVNPFMTLSFLALPVIPDLKISNRGLIDVNNFCITSLFA